METGQKNPGKYSNPYMSGFLMGILLIVSYLILGTGLGASSGMARAGAFLEMLILESYTLSTEYFGGWGENPLSYYLVYMVVGTVAGGFFSALMNRRISVEMTKGKSFPSKKRAAYAVAGGILVGFASRLARGCTSGQVLTGGALMLTGSFVFLICIFAGGYAAAHLFRRQWYD